LLEETIVPGENHWPAIHIISSIGNIFLLRLHWHSSGALLNVHVFYDLDQDA
jgi:hypothetical protein